MKLNWSGNTVVLIGGGPSLTKEQVECALKSGCKIIAINNAYQVCPEADVLYACDKKWWLHYKPNFAGHKYSLEYDEDDVFKLKNTGTTGIDFIWPNIRTGRNSGYQAVNLAIHFGCKKIILIGYDMQYTNNKKHWHPDHPRPLNNCQPIASFASYFNSLLPILKKNNIEVINCSLATAITGFPIADLRSVLL
jgi:hypothetical protein